MNIPSDLKYAKTHEWAKIEGENALIGISDHAQHAMGDIVFVELPEIGSVLKAGDVLGVVESVKAVSDVYTPIGGKILEINEEIIDAPEKINEDPYASWMIKLEITNKEEIESLFTKEQYEEMIK